MLNNCGYKFETMEILRLNKETVGLKRTEEWLENEGESVGVQMGESVRLPKTEGASQKPSSSSPAVQMAKKKDLLYQLNKGTLPARIPIFSDFPVVRFGTKAPYSATNWHGEVLFRNRDNKSITKFPYDQRFQVALSLAQHNRSWWARKFPIESKKFVKGEPEASMIIYIIFVYDRTVFGDVTQVYVGLTKDTFVKRLAQHCSVHSTLFDLALHAVNPEGVVCMVLDMALDVKGMKRLEDRYIKMFCSLGPAGLNMISGSTK